VQILTGAEKQTVLVRGVLDGRHFFKVDLSDAIFDEASCRHTVFGRTDLRRARFHNALLDNALFLRCDLTGVDLQGACLLHSRFVACTGIKPTLAASLKKRGANVLQDRECESDESEPLSPWDE
jgi:uncharacterized protein YjbI with pentapeptide repeats